MMTYMKKIIYLIALSVLLFAGCSKHSVAPEAPEQFDRYIFFSQQVQTKASLIESGDAMGQFGVVGFKYDKDQYENFSGFISANPTQEPNVFFDDAGARVDVETCWVDGTNASYAPLQGWSNSKKYSFFAYYPIENDHVTLVNTADGTAYSGGVPAIKYSINTDNPKESMVDVMIATPQENKYWHSDSDNNLSSGEILFEFAHCLSSLGVKIRNSSAGNIMFQGIYLDIEDIQYQQIVLPLDGSTLPPVADPFDISLYGLSVSDASSLAPGSFKELSDKVILIPQSNTEVSIRIIVSYKRQFGNGEPSSLLTSEPYTLTSNLTTGKKHMISLNFKDSTVEVGGEVSTEGWIDIPDVEDTFN